jgi:hypothetical protein
MSDKDIDFLRNIEKQWLSLNNSEKQFREILWKIKWNYEQILNKWQQTQQQTTQWTQWWFTPKDATADEMAAYNKIFWWQ